MGDSARVTVIRGEAEFTAAGKTYPFHADETRGVQGTDNIDFAILKAQLQMADTWADQRDRREDNPSP